MMRLILFLFLVSTTSSAFAEGNVNYQYDALGRLIRVTNETGPNAGTVSDYILDPAGNRTNVTVTGAQKRVIVLPLNGFTIIPLN